MSFFQKGGYTERGFEQTFETVCFEAQIQPQILFWKIKKVSWKEVENILKFIKSSFLRSNKGPKVANFRDPVLENCSKELDSKEEFRDDWVGEGFAMNTGKLVVQEDDE